MAIITLTTDLGLKDYYVGAIKGYILAQLPTVNIVDISHLITPFDIAEAAYVIRNSYSSFPKGTVHIIGVLTEETASTPHVCIQYDEHYFIGADNGMFSLIFSRKPDKIIELTLPPESGNLLFPTRDSFAKAACHIARGGTLEIIGKPMTHFNEKTFLQPALFGNVLRGSVIYIDSFNNAITNISRSIVKEVGKGKPFTIDMGSKFKIHQLSKTYNDVPEGEIVGLFNSADYLEIAINKGNASQLLNLQNGDTISLHFL